MADGKGQSKKRRKQESRPCPFYSYKRFQEFKNHVGVWSCWNPILFWDKSGICKVYNLIMASFFFNLIIGFRNILHFIIIRK